MCSRIRKKKKTLHPPVIFVYRRKKKTYDRSQSPLFQVKNDEYNVILLCTRRTETEPDLLHDGTRKLFMRIIFCLRLDPAG